MRWWRYSISDPFFFENVLNCTNYLRMNSPASHLGSGLGGDTPSHLHGLGNYCYYYFVWFLFRVEHFSSTCPRGSRSLHDIGEAEIVLVTRLWKVAFPTGLLKLLSSRVGDMIMIESMQVVRRRSWVAAVRRPCSTRTCRAEDPAPWWAWWATTAPAPCSDQVPWLAILFWGFLKDRDLLYSIFEYERSWLIQNR